MLPLPKLFLLSSALSLSLLAGRWIFFSGWVELKRLLVCKVERIASEGTGFDVDEPIDFCFWKVGTNKVLEGSFSIILKVCGTVCSSS